MFTLATFSIAVIIIIIIIIIIIVVVIIIIIVVIIIAIIIVIIVIIMIIIAVSACIALIQFTLALLCLTRETTQDLLFVFRFIRFYEVFKQTPLSNSERNWLSVKRLLYIWRL